MMSVVTAPILRPEDEDLSRDRLFTLIDLDEMFNSVPNAKIVNNDMLISRKLSKEFSDAIFSNCDGDLGFVPTCECGKTYGLAKKGLICPECGTVCSSQFVDALSHNSWIGIPEGYSPVLHPIWYLVLRNWTAVARGAQSIIDTILDPRAEAPEDFIPFDRGRGYSYFYEHFDDIFHMLAYEYPRTMKKASSKGVITLYKHYRKVVFTRHIPILHSSLHPLRSNGSTLKYTDNTPKDILAAIVDLSMITFRTHSVRSSSRQKDITLYNVYMKIISYMQLLITQKLGEKQALLRKHCFGTRVHFSARTVVTPHDYVRPIDEIVLPWKLIVNSLKLQIINFLVFRYNYEPADAVARFTMALEAYDALIDEIVRTIIHEFPDGKMTIALGRNPTLAYGSILKLYVKEYRTDPEDEVISINACIVKPANIDFDGDESYFITVLTKELANAISAIHPSQLLFSTASPGLGSRIGLLQQNWVTLEAFLEDDDDESGYYHECS